VHLPSDPVTALERRRFSIWHRCSIHHEGTKDHEELQQQRVFVLVYLRVLRAFVVKGRTISVLIL
jgi:hypothetical protein